MNVLITNLSILRNPDPHNKVGPTYTYDNDKWEWVGDGRLTNEAPTIAIIDKLKNSGGLNKIIYICILD